MAVTTTPETAGVMGHEDAGESHDQAAETLRMAAECHQKGDHSAGLVHAENAVKLSQAALDAAKAACAESKAAAQ